MRCIARDSFLEGLKVNNLNNITVKKVMELSRSIRKYRNCILQEKGLTSPQGDVLRHIIHNPGCTASDILEALNLSQSTVAGILKRLECKGLILRRVDANDSRKALIELTEEGEKLMDYVRATSEDTENILTEGMDAAQQAELLRLLEIAGRNIELELSRRERRP